MSDINNFSHLEIWFVTGSQHLYGPAALAKVDEHAKEVVAALNPAAPPAPDHLLAKHFYRKHGPGAYYGQAKPRA